MRNKSPRLNGDDPSVMRGLDLFVFSPPLPHPLTWLHEENCVLSSFQMDDDASFVSNIPVAVDITVAVVYSVFGVCSLFGNSVLLYISYKKKRHLKPAECFIVNLAISDLGLTLSLYPMAITSSLYHRWLYGRAMCYLYAFCGMFFGICSLTTLTLLSMVCCVKVCYPLYGNRFHSSHGCVLIGCAWAYALLFAAAPLAGWGEYGPEPYGTACCIDWHLSNRHARARSFTAVLFLCCYIVPCCVIVASYSAILVLVRASRKSMERHAARPARHMGSIQAVIVKLSVAVCTGFFAAWSPYAIVSMWAAFGHVDAIPPLAFAMPAMFAKSSTIYNPVIYLTLRPSFRSSVCRHLGFLCRRCYCLSCVAEQPPPPPDSKRRAPAVGPRSFRDRQTRRSSNDANAISSAALRQTLGSKFHSGGDKCSDAFECFRHYPRVQCRAVNPVARGHEVKGQGPPISDSQTDRGETQSLCQVNRVPAAVGEKGTSDNLQINLQMVPGNAKEAWS
ncbi:hypothetical protein NHX12_003627 [Muraenolepis orangiensis]|uniref:G-protein coupled receptors family 1 profile domain-containing protein n=1 Tax=Muraenolepis orangiensis TaxID=630683 RepID=A0A9Q0DWA2_9TELE|nr:hypothetical protein NHX12_003627 [Muraenolepis orangiensis]